MKCFACDILVTSEAYDSKTDRYYCQTCMEFTNETILNQELREADKDYGSELVDRLGELQEDVSFESLDQDDDEAPWDE